MLIPLREIIFNQRSFNHFFRHLKVAEWTYRTIFFPQVYFKVSAFWFCSHYLLPVSLTGANFLLVLSIPVANCHRCCWHWLQICHRYRWHRWHPGINKNKGYWGKNLPLVLLILMVHLDLWISLRIFQKNFKCPKCIFRGLGMMIHEENLKQKILWHSLNTVGAKTLFPEKSLSFTLSP